MVNRVECVLPASSGGIQRIVFTKTDDTRTLINNHLAVVGTCDDRPSISIETSPSAPFAHTYLEDSLFFYVGERSICFISLTVFYTSGKMFFLGEIICVLLSGGCVLNLCICLASYQHISPLHACPVQEFFVRTVHAEQFVHTLFSVYVWDK